MAKKKKKTEQKKKLAGFLILVDHILAGIVDAFTNVTNLQHPMWK